MPKPQACDGCNQAQAVVLVQNLESGDSLLFCPPCSGTWAQVHAAKMAELFPELLADDGDTPDTADTAQDGQAGPDLAAQDSETESATRGGDDSGAVRSADPGLPGGSASAADRGGPGGSGDAAPGAGEPGTGDGADGAPGPAGDGNGAAGTAGPVGSTSTELSGSAP